MSRDREAFLRELRQLRTELESDTPTLGQTDLEALITTVTTSEHLSVRNRNGLLRRTFDFDESNPKFTIKNGIAFRALIAAGADVSFGKGNGILHAAVEIGDENLVGMLLDSGYDTHKRNDRGQQPLDLIAQRSKSTSKSPSGPTLKSTKSESKNILDRLEAENLHNVLGTNVRTNYLYHTDDINDLMHHYRDNDGIIPNAIPDQELVIPPAITTFETLNDQQENILFDSLQYHFEQTGMALNQRILVPYNLGGGHYVGILVDMQSETRRVQTGPTSEEMQTFTNMNVAYMDPLGGPIPENVRNEITFLAGLQGPDRFTLDLQEVNMHMQPDFYACGVYTVDNLVEAGRRGFQDIRAHGVAPPQPNDVQQRRYNHIQILGPGFQTRQEQNHVLVTDTVTPFYSHNSGTVALHRREQDQRVRAILAETEKMSSGVRDQITEAFHRDNQKHRTHAAYCDHTRQKLYTAILEQAQKPELERGADYDAVMNIADQVLGLTPDNILAIHEHHQKRLDACTMSFTDYKLKYTTDTIEQEEFDNQFYFGASTVKSKDFREKILSDIINESLSFRSSYEENLLIGEFGNKGILAYEKSQEVSDELSPQEKPLSLVESLQITRTDLEHLGTIIEALDDEGLSFEEALEVAGGRAEDMSKRADLMIDSNPHIPWEILEFTGQDLNRLGTRKEAILAELAPQRANLSTQLKQMYQREEEKFEKTLASARKTGTQEEIETLKTVEAPEAPEALNDFEAPKRLPSISELSKVFNHYHELTYLNTAKARIDQLLASNFSETPQRDKVDTAVRTLVITGEALKAVRTDETELPKEMRRIGLVLRNNMSHIDWPDVTQKITALRNPEGASLTLFGNEGEAHLGGLNDELQALSDRFDRMIQSRQQRAQEADVRQFIDSIPPMTDSFEFRANKLAGILESVDISAAIKREIATELEINLESTTLREEITTKLRTYENADHSLSALLERTSNDSAIEEVEREALRAQSYPLDLQKSTAPKSDGQSDRNFSAIKADDPKFADPDHIQQYIGCLKLHAPALQHTIQRKETRYQALMLETTASDRSTFKEQKRERDTALKELQEARHAKENFDALIQKMTRIKSELEQDNTDYNVPFTTEERNFLRDAYSTADMMGLKEEFPGINRGDIFKALKPQLGTSSKPSKTGNKGPESKDIIKENIATIFDESWDDLNIGELPNISALARHFKIDEHRFEADGGEAQQVIRENYIISKKLTSVIEALQAGNDSITMPELITAVQAEFKKENSGIRDERDGYIAEQVLHHEALSIIQDLDQKARDRSAPLTAPDLITAVQDAFKRDSTDNDPARDALLQEKTVHYLISQQLEQRDLEHDRITPDIARHTITTELTAQLRDVDNTDQIIEDRTNRYCQHLECPTTGSLWRRNVDHAISVIESLPADINWEELSQPQWRSIEQKLNDTSKYVASFYRNEAFLADFQEDSTSRQQFLDNSKTLSQTRNDLSHRVHHNDPERVKATITMLKTDMKRLLELTKEKSVAKTKEVTKEINVTDLQAARKSMRQLLSKTPTKEQTGKKLKRTNSSPNLNTGS